MTLKRSKIISFSFVLAHACLQDKDLFTESSHSTSSPHLDATLTNVLRVQTFKGKPSREILTIISSLTKELQAGFKEENHEPAPV